MSNRELLDGVTTTPVRADSLAFLDLGLDGGFTAKVPGDIILQELLEEWVLDHDTALSRGDVPIIRGHTISITYGRIGGSVKGVVREALGAASLGVIDTGQNVESDGTGLGWFFIPMGSSRMVLSWVRHAKTFLRPDRYKVE
jgi:hypothetical protein